MEKRDLEAVLILKKEYEAMKEAARKLEALEAAGVDNWAGYDYAIKILANMER